MCILIAAEDEDGNRHWSEVFSDEYDMETTFQKARDEMTFRIRRTPLTFRAYRIAEDPFASSADEDNAPVILHNFEDVG
jgi:hypothetical protein